ncbi:hypothetical protein BgiMline_025079 [Biomphalaria glabrata]|nr:hypothetical protein BgiMline_008228 [Biomphalaria glabrata]
MMAPLSVKYRSVFKATRQSGEQAADMNKTAAYADTTVFKTLFYPYPNCRAALSSTAFFDFKGTQIVLISDHPFWSVHY